MQRLSHISILVLSLFCTLLLSDVSKGESDESELILSQKLQTHWTKRIKKLMGGRDAAILAMPDGKPILSVSPDRLLIPASTLKILTALVAIHHLGCDYRFPTDFYLDTQKNLKIKGYGDPLLVSENLIVIARKLGEKVDRLSDIIIDDSYFQNTASIPGKNKSLQPYDAPIGAFCVNFNTVFFKKINNTYVSAEDQTPLLPFALSKVKSSGLKQGRIMLAGNKDEGLHYAGELIRYFLTQSGIKISGNVRRGIVQPASDRLLLHHLSPNALDQVIAQLMDFSNNFIANQLLLTAGAKALGAPANLTKGVQTADSYVRNRLGLTDIAIAEGSGLSRQNRISAATMIELLRHFAPYYRLLRHKDKEYYKTGTLSDVKSRAGYLEGEGGRTYPFVVLVNTPGKSTKTVMQIFRQIIAGVRGTSPDKPGSTNSLR